MRLRHTTHSPDRRKADSGKGKQIGKVAAAAVAAVMLGSPLFDKPAMAQETQPPAATEEKKDDKAKISEKKLEDTEKKEPAAGGDAEKPVTVPSKEVLTTVEETVPQPEESVAPVDTRQIGYMDAALSKFDEEVDATGKPRKIKLGHDWNLGGRLRVTEAASSVAASVRYSRYVDFSAGNMWFGEQPAPFATLTGLYAQDVWRLKFLYGGRVSAVGNMPSILYTSHSAGIGYSQPIGNWKLRMGGVIGGALSYPNWDDIYLKFIVGASIEWDKKLLIYAAPSFYFAANNPTQTAYVGYYRPRFQEVHAGVQWSMPDNYSGRVFAKVGVLGENYGARLAKTMYVSDTLSVDLWGTVIATRWNEELGGSSSWGGRWDFGAMAGLTIVLVGDKVNTTTSAVYEHIQAGGVRYAETDFPTTEEPGPYGFGRSKNELWDTPVNDAKKRMLNASTFQEFSEGYQGASQEEVVRVARFIGGFMQQVAYANDAKNSMYNTDFFDPEVRRIASVSNEGMFYYLQRYVDWYENNPADAPLPEDLRNGIAVCAGIHSLMADFLRANGVPALVLSVNTRRGPHVIASGQLPNETLFFDYGNTYSTPAGTFDQTLRFYGQNQQAPTFQSQIFNANGYLGTYETAEGRLLHMTIGIPEDALFMRAVLGVRDFY